MSIHAAHAKLKRATQQLQSRWERSADGWSDATRTTFHANYIEPLEPSVRSAMKAMEQIAGTISRARNDVEDRGE